LYANVRASFSPIRHSKQSSRAFSKAQSLALRAGRPVSKCANWSIGFNFQQTGFNLNHRFQIEIMSITSNSFGESIDPQFCIRHPPSASTLFKKVENGTLYRIESGTYYTHGGIVFELIDVRFAIRRPLQESLVGARVCTKMKKTLRHRQFAWRHGGALRRQRRYLQGFVPLTGRRSADGGGNSGATVLVARFAFPHINTSTVDSSNAIILL
jgi:hypothetical protein